MKYLGYYIEKNDDPWAKQFNCSYTFSFGNSLDEQQWTACSIEDAKEQIDELIAEEMEWIIEALGEGYTKKQLAKNNNISIYALNKLLKQHFPLTF